MTLVCTEYKPDKGQPPPLSLASAVAIFPLTYGLFQGLSRILPPGLAYLIGSIAYWGLLAVLSFAFLGPNGLVAVFRRRSIKSTGSKAASTGALLMALPPLFIAFLPSIPGLTVAMWGLLCLSALCNGVLEEAFWRGVFVSQFDDIWRAYVLPCTFFVLWHVTLAAMPGMHYHGGGTALIGGAAVFGIVWGFVSWRQRSIFITTIAHVLVNFFAFSGLILENWPG